MALVNDFARYDRRAIMREAHRVFRMMRGRGWRFADACSLRGAGRVRRGTYGSAN